MIERGTAIKMPSVRWLTSMPKYLASLIAKITAKMIPVRINIAYQATLKEPNSRAFFSNGGVWPRVAINNSIINHNTKPIPIAYGSL